MADRKLIRFVSQRTLMTGSDHRTLIVQVEIRNPRGKWEALYLISCNMGGRFSRADMEHLFKFAGRLSSPAIFCMQEGGDQKWLADMAPEFKYRYLGGHGRAGQASTPMLIPHRIKIRRKRWIETLGHVFVGKGAGPDYSKPKWFVQDRFIVGRVKFGCSSFHATASQQYKRRFLVSIRESRPVVKALMASRQPYFVVGDTNSDDDQPLSRWFRRHGMTTNHRQLGEIPTHGKRSIDAVMCAKRLVKGLR